MARDKQQLGSVLILTLLMLLFLQYVAIAVVNSTNISSQIVANFQRGQQLKKTAIKAIDIVINNQDHFASYSKYLNSQGEFSANLTTITATGLKVRIIDFKCLDLAPAESHLNSAGDGFKALLDDLNTPVAISELYRLAKAVNQADGPEQLALMQELKGLSDILGLLQQDPEQWFTLTRGNDQLSAEQIEQQIQARHQAKHDKDFSQADQIRQQLLDAGVVLEDSREGTKWRRA